MKSQIVLELNPTQSNARNSEGSFITLQSGRILFAWSKYTTGNFLDEAPSILVCRHSDDGGISWSSEDRVLVEPEGDAHNVMSVSLLRLRNGRILCLYLQKEKSSKGIYQCLPYIRFSDDEMETLSAPTPLMFSTEWHVVNNDRIIQLQNGTLIIPIAQHRFAMQTAPPLGDNLEAGFKAPGTIFFLISHDNGQTWSESRNSFYRAFPDGSGFQEPGVVELNDGRLWAWARTQWKNGEARSRQWQSFSTDGGEVWSEPGPSDFISPCSPLSMKRIPQTGDLLAVWNDRSGRFPVPEKPDYCDRQPLVGAISSDEGKTWRNHSLLEDAPNHGYCYTAIHFVDDAILLAYCAGGPEPQNCLQRLRMTRLTLQDFYGDGDTDLDK